MLSGIVHAFSDNETSGNPALVVVCPELPTEAEMQKMASEAGLPIATFVAPNQPQFSMRHRSPSGEAVELCGHGTIAAAEFLRGLGVRGNLHFDLGELTVTVESCAGWHTLRMPSFESTLMEVPDGFSAVRAYRSRYDCILELASQSDVLSHPVPTVVPDGFRTLTITAPGEDADYCYRVFAPELGIPEDRFCGSVNAELGPLWCSKLNKCALLGRSLAEWGGSVLCVASPTHTSITGRAHVREGRADHLTAVAGRG